MPPVQRTPTGMIGNLSDESSRSKVRPAANRTFRLFLKIFPILLGVLALVSLITAAFPAERIAGLLPAQGILGTLAGVFLGGVFAGNPVTSYVLAGELMAGGVSLTAVTAFIVSWVTLGILHIAAEGAILGLRFTLFRSALCIVFAVTIAELIGMVMSHV
jgi:uncharacterized membrane protein YraQ (UPF0718 family)